MSELGPVVEEQPGAPSAPPQEPAAPVSEVTQPPAEDDIPEAVEVAPGHAMVPVGVVKALRAELKSLKPLAERAAQLEQEVNQSRPYVDFLRNNQQILQPQAQPAPVAPDPADDPELVELARTLELYDPATGKPDVKRAQTFTAISDKRAERIAEQRMAPVQERTYEQQAAANIQNILGTKLADGTALDPQYLTAAVKSITAALPKGEAMKVLADPTVASVVELTALGLQAKGRKAAPVVPAPAADPLHVETAGGSREVALSEGSRRLARMAGKSDKEWQDSAKRYVPGRANALE